MNIMHRKTVYIAIAICSFTSIRAQEQRKDTLPPFFSLSYIPSLSWKIKNITNDDGDFLKYRFDANSLSSIEGNFGIRQIGLKLGVSANIENNMVGKAYRWGGYLGFRNYWLRLQTTTMSGEVTWEGQLPVGFAREYTFSKKYLNVELLKTFRKKRYIDGKWVIIPDENQMGFYWGIGYTSLGMPVKMSTLVTPGGRENQKFGVPAYDNNFNAKFYTFAAGVDLLRNLSLTGGKYGLIPGKAPMRFAMYASTADKVGFGTGQLSDFGVRMAEALNPGLDFVSSKSFSVLVHYSLSAGFRYIVYARPVFLIFTAGYDLEGASVVPFGGAADTNKDLGYEYAFFYINHGVSFKLYISWIGKR